MTNVALGVMAGSAAIQFVRYLEKDKMVVAVFWGLLALAIAATSIVT